jgi:hypothetical protein
MMTKLNVKTEIDMIAFLKSLNKQISSDERMSSKIKIASSTTFQLP